jgi:ATP-dependent Lon protease
VNIAEKKMKISHVPGQQPLESPGLVTGLSWTTMGGATLSIEATLVHY